MISRFYRGMEYYMKKFDAVAIGELLIDFVEYGTSGQGNTVFEANPGGAPCNVLAMLSRLGKKTAFIGKVGNDGFGKTLIKTLEDLDIDAGNIMVDKEVHTTLAFVQTLEKGESDFSFYRNPGADMMLAADEVNVDLVADAGLLHFGTLSMTHKLSEEATKKAVSAAKDSGALVSFDPNLREPLWDSLEHAANETWWGIERCDILKISDNEIRWLTGENDFTEGVRAIRKRADVPLILVSMGRDGSRAYYGDLMVEEKPFLQKATIETTGAGDAFCGCAVNYILDHGLDDLNGNSLREMLTFANAAASIVTTRKGALKAMPKRAETEELIRSAGR